MINILAVGLTGYLNRQLFATARRPAPAVLPRLHVPVLADLPVVGPILFQQQPIALLAIVLVFVLHFALFRTRWGLRTRAVGEHPLAADTVGINVYRLRYVNVVLGGADRRAGGAYFTLESVPHFEPLMTNGRGFIALAAMIFGKWTPFGAWGAALLFGVAEALPVDAADPGDRRAVPARRAAAVRADDRGGGGRGRAAPRRRPPIGMPYVKR